MVEEFLTKDLGRDIAKAGGGVMIIPQRRTSILLDDTLRARLKRRANKMGIGYQTLAKMLLAKYADDDL